MPIFKSIGKGDSELDGFMSRADLRDTACRDLANRSIVGVSSYFVIWLIIYLTSDLSQEKGILIEFSGFLLAAIGVARLYLALRFKSLHAARPTLWRWLFALGAFLSAAIWGGVCALALNFDGLGTTSMVVLLAAAGIAAGGIVSLAPAKWLGGLFIGFLLLPIVLFALTLGTAAANGVAVVILAFLFFMFFLWLQLHQEYWQALADHTDLIRAKEAAEEANQAKGLFIANVSHELRTPLTTIIGALGIIESDLSGDLSPQALKLVGMAFENGQHLSALINDLLDFEKLNAGRMTFDRRPLALIPCVERALELNRLFAARHQVTFAFKPCPQEIQVNVDEQRLLQVMTNLLSNAAKHSPAGGEVTISVRPRDGMVRVAVSDHGTGVPESFRPHVFEKFAQAASATTGKNHGTGLGLAISKMIVEGMGGTIGFDSEWGKGATFYFDLPVLHPSQTDIETRND